MRVAVGLFLALFLIESANGYTIKDGSGGGIDESLIAKVADRFTDPDAVQFRQLHLKDGVLCGELNGKNAFGAYTGYVQFFADKGWLFVAGLEGIQPATVAKRCD